MRHLNNTYKTLVLGMVLTVWLPAIIQAEIYLNSDGKSDPEGKPLLSSLPFTSTGSRNPQGIVVKVFNESYQANQETIARFKKLNQHLLAWELEKGLKISDPYGLVTRKYKFYNSPLKLDRDKALRFFQQDGKDFEAYIPLLIDAARKWYSSGGFSRQTQFKKTMEGLGVKVSPDFFRGGGYSTRKDYTKNIQNPRVKKMMEARNKRLAEIKKRQEESRKKAEKALKTTAGKRNGTFLEYKGARASTMAEGKAAVPFLIGCLGRGRIKYAAIEKLGELGADAKDAVPELEKFLKGDDLQARTMVAQTLAKINGTKISKADLLKGVNKENLKKPEEIFGYLQMSSDYELKDFDGYVKQWAENYQYYRRTKVVWKNDDYIKVLDCYSDNFREKLLPHLTKCLKKTQKDEFKKWAVHQFSKYRGKDYAALIGLYDVAGGDLYNLVNNEFQTLGPKAADALPLLIKKIDDNKKADMKTAISAVSPETNIAEYMVKNKLVEGKNIVSFTYFANIRDKATAPVVKELLKLLLSTEHKKTHFEFKNRILDLILKQGEYNKELAGVLLKLNDVKKQKERGLSADELTIAYLKATGSFEQTLEDFGKIINHTWAKKVLVANAVMTGKFDDIFKDERKICLVAVQKNPMYKGGTEWLDARLKLDPKTKRFYESRETKKVKDKKELFRIFQYPYSDLIGYADKFSDKNLKIVLNRLIDAPEFFHIFPKKQVVLDKIAEIYTEEKDPARRQRIKVWFIKDVRRHRRAPLTIAKAFVSDIIKEYPKLKAKQHRVKYAQLFFNVTHPELRDQIVDFLFERFYDEDRDISAAAYNVLESFGTMIMPQLKKRIIGDDPIAAMTACELVAEMSLLGQDAVPELEKVVDGDNWALKPYAIKALGEIGDKNPRIVDKVKKLEKSDNKEVQNAAKIASILLSQLKKSE